MRSKPSFGVFFGISAALIAVFAIVTPWPDSFNDPGGGLAPSADDPDRCLRLSYAGADFKSMPTTIRLLPQQYIVMPPDAPWYRTDGYRPSWIWRPAGPDSVDLAGHHGPVLRIPMTGAGGAGRGGWPGHVNVLEALLSKQWQVHATAVPCSMLP